MVPPVIILIAFGCPLVVGPVVFAPKKTDLNLDAKSSPSNPKDNLSATRLRQEGPKRVFGCWVEVRKEVDGKVTEDALDLLGWELTTENAGCWERRGESVYTRFGVARLRTDKSPWWLDIVGESPETGKPRVWPGIARLEKGRLIWVRARDWEPPPAPGRDCRGRPQSFDVTRPAGYERVTLTRTTGRYAQD
jgi:uncharacterized protein (TIGR03067 family)